MSIVWSLEDTRGKESALYLATTEPPTHPPSTNPTPPPSHPQQKQSLRGSVVSAPGMEKERRRLWSQVEEVETHWWVAHAITLAHHVCLTRCRMCRVMQWGVQRMFKEIWIRSLVLVVHSLLFGVGGMNNRLRVTECDFLGECCRAYTCRSRKQTHLRALDPTSATIIVEDFPIPRKTKTKFVPNLFWTGEQVQTRQLKVTQIYYSGINTLTFCRLRWS